VPKITGIGQLLLKLSLVVGWYPFLRHSVDDGCALYIPECVHASKYQFIRLVTELTAEIFVKHTTTTTESEALAVARWQHC